MMHTSLFERVDSTKQEPFYTNWRSCHEGLLLVSDGAPTKRAWVQAYQWLKNKPQDTYILEQFSPSHLLLSSLRAKLVCTCTKKAPLYERLRLPATEALMHRSSCRHVFRLSGSCWLFLGMSHEWQSRIGDFDFKLKKHIWCSTEKRKWYHTST